MNARAEQTIRATKVARMIGLARPRRRLPRQVPPVSLEREYAIAVLAFLEPIWPLFAPLLDELPGLLNTAQRERSDAGEGKRIRELLEGTAKRVADHLSTAAVEELAAKFARRTATYQRIQLSRQTKAALGADIFMADRTLETRIEGFAAENAALITDIPAKLAADIAKAATRAIQDATPHPEFAKDLAAKFGFAKDRAKLIARDQVGKFYGQINAARQKEMGVDRFIWRTVEDERVRPEHDALDGQSFAYSDPPAEGLPGEPILCRCSAEPDFTAILEGL